MNQNVRTFRQLNMFTCLTCLRYNTLDVVSQDLLVLALRILARVYSRKARRQEKYM